MLLPPLEFQFSPSIVKRPLRGRKADLYLAGNGAEEGESRRSSSREMRLTNERERPRLCKKTILQKLVVATVHISVSA